MGQRHGGDASFRELIAGARRVCLDTNACIYYLGQVEDPYPDMVEIALQCPDAGPMPHISGLVYMELLGHPMKSGSEAERRVIEEFILEATGEGPKSIDVDELAFAAQIRARTNMKPPDALVAASAAVHGCDVIVTNDSDFLRLELMYDMPFVRRGKPALQVPRVVLLSEYVDNIG